VTCDRRTQTFPRLTPDQCVVVAEGSTQTLPTGTRDNVSQVTHVLTRDGATSTEPPATTFDMGTAMPPRDTATSWTQVLRIRQQDFGICMPPVLVQSIGCQARAYFDNEVIPPGAPRPKLPWANTYTQFDALLAAYPNVHLEDLLSRIASTRRSRVVAPTESGGGGRRAVSHGRWKAGAGERTDADYTQNAAPGSR